MHQMHNEEQAQPAESWPRGLPHKPLVDLPTWQTAPDTSGHKRQRQENTTTGDKTRRGKKFVVSLLLRQQLVQVLKNDGASVGDRKHIVVRTG
eukprot:1308283-Pyramimonas_sp.AAC.3